MSFEKSDAVLIALADKSIVEAEELRKGLEGAGYEPDEIHDDIRENSASIWEVVNSDIRRLDALEKQVDDAKRSVESDSGRRPNLLDSGSAMLAIIPGLLVFFLIALAIWFVVKLVRNWGATLSSLMTLDGALWTLILVVLPILVIVLCA